MILQLMANLKCHFADLLAAITDLSTATNTTITVLDAQCVSIDGGEPQLATPATIWDDVAQAVVGTKWLNMDGTEITGVVEIRDVCDCLAMINCCPADDATEGFSLAGVDKSDNSKFAFDTPTFDKAHGDAGSNNWTTADLIAALNASAAGATPANNNSAVDYTTTTFGAHPTNPDVIVVTAGPVPTTLDLVSINVSIPLTTV